MFEITPKMELTTWLSKTNAKVGYTFIEKKKTIFFPEVRKHLSLIS